MEDTRSAGCLRHLCSVLRVACLEQNWPGLVVWQLSGRLRCEAVEKSALQWASVQSGSRHLLLRVVFGLVQPDVSDRCSCKAYLKVVKDIIHECLCGCGLSF